METKLLQRIAHSFPLSPRPFRELGEEVGLEEGECLGAVRDLLERGVVREIAPVFHPPSLGYVTALAAFKVPAAKLENAALVVNRHPGVSHNYARDGEYNLWFTLSLPRGRDLEAEVSALGGYAGASDVLFLPALRTFKLASPFVDPSPASPEERPLSPEEVEVIRRLQEPLPLLPEPFDLLAGDFGTQRLLQIARHLLVAGIMKRYAARLNHFRAGLPAGALCCWQVPDQMVEEAGRFLASLPQVSHCYLRASYPRWPYNLYAMIHGKTRDEVEEVASRAGLYPLKLLFTVKEYKKERVKYFCDGFISGIL